MADPAQKPRFQPSKKTAPAAAASSEPEPKPAPPTDSPAPKTEKGLDEWLASEDDWE